MNTVGEFFWLVIAIDRALNGEGRTDRGRNWRPVEKNRGRDYAIMGTYDNPILVMGDDFCDAPD